MWGKRGTAAVLALLCFSIEAVAEHLFPITAMTTTAAQTSIGALPDGKTFGLPKGSSFRQCEMVDEDTLIARVNVQNEKSSGADFDFSNDARRSGIQVWNLKTNVKVADFPDGTFSLSPDRKKLAVYDDDSRFRVYQVEGGKQIGPSNENKESARVIGIPTITDVGDVIGKRLIPEGERKNSSVYTGIGIFRSDGSHRKTVELKQAIGFTEVMGASGDGKKFVVGKDGRPPKVEIVDLESGTVTELSKLAQEWRARPQSVQLSSDGRYLAVVTDRLIVVDLQTQAIAFQHSPAKDGKSAVPTQVTFSGDSRRLAWVSAAGAEWLDLPPTGAPTSAPGIAGPNCLAFSPSGNRLVGRSESAGQADWSRIRILDLPRK